MKISAGLWSLLIFFGVLFAQLFTDIPIFPILLVVIFVSIFGIIIITKFDLSIPFLNSSPKMEKEIAEKTKQDLNIDNRKWRQLSRKKKWQMNKYAQKQEKLMRKRGNLFTKIVRPEVTEEWKYFTLEERIKRIDEDDRNKLESDYRSRIRADKKFIKDEKLANEKALEEKRRLRFEDQQREKRDKEKSILEKQQREKELELNRILAQKRSQENIELKKREKDRSFKERIKRELLEKERKKELESQAIQELIESGAISDNYSLQNKREPIPSHIKEAVWKRDKQCCVDCGRTDKLEFDHNIPVSKGGSNSINNIRILCQECNRRKSNRIT